MSEKLRTEERQIIKSTNYLTTNLDLDSENREISSKKNNENFNDSFNFKSPNQSLKEYILVEKNSNENNKFLVTSSLNFQKPPKVEVKILILTISYYEIFFLKF